MRKLKLEQAEVFEKEDVSAFQNALKNKNPSRFLIDYLSEKRVNDLATQNEVPDEAAK